MHMNKGLLMKKNKNRYLSLIKKNLYIMTNKYLHRLNPIVNSLRSKGFNF
jgi:hypothetical protein